MKGYIFFCIFFLCACTKKEKLFSLVASDHSGITFSNLIQENDSLNILDVENLYNGGGVGIGDFNNDGLQDIYFTGNEVSNKLYLNKGDFKFEDITEAANVNGAGRWCRGVSVIDINNDGFLDMYISASLSKDSKKRENLLYVNTGVDKKGYPYFKNMAAAYGLADTSHTTMAAFFDYDNDGDLDVYLLVNQIVKGQNPGTFTTVSEHDKHPNTDKLFRNDWNDSLKHPVFTNISKEAGIILEGYGHGVNIVDINSDGWKDIYVTNDFLSNNILYINNHNGTFTNEVKAYFKHTSENSMGQDVIDINNDGLVDVMEVDMNPEDNLRKKTMMNTLHYQRYQYNEFYGYQHQYVRNVLQINQGPRVLENDSLGPPVFSDVAFYSGIAQTDWSWTPSIADFDNDGYRDIIITNGFPKDVTDHDFGAFRSKAYNLVSKKELLEEIPKVKISNYAYKNNGDLTFEDVTKDWGMSVPTFSNGAAYADLDNDGDLDYVVNNINDEALVYRNNSRDLNKNGHYLQIQFLGDRFNKNGLGASVELHYKAKQQVYENTPYRGYLSSIYPMAHFGLGHEEVIDSIIIKWPNGKMQLMQNVKADQLVKADIKNANSGFSFFNPSIASGSLLKEITSSVNVNYVHKEHDFVDFNIQKLLPHKLSEYGPALAAGDIDGNGLDDFISGGSLYFDTQIFLQQNSGNFIRKTLLGKGDSIGTKNYEDLGLLLFDADNDNDLDLYVASGGYELKNNSHSYKDRFYVNDGKGNFQQDSLVIPENFTSKSCVRAADFDRDGDLDLFVGGRVEPWNYPKPVSSFIYRNDTKKGVIKFTDVTSAVAPALNNIGLVCDAIWSDYDNDGWQDLVLAGEWMPLTFLKNEKGTFTSQNSSIQLPNSTGWWNTIAPGDFDNDGDIDYIFGNLGENSFYKGSKTFPVSVYAKDFDKNGVLECITTKYLRGKEGILKEYTIPGRDDVVDQMPFIKKKFLSYKSFAEASFADLFTKDELNDAIVYHANYFKSIFLENKGNGSFNIRPLPIQAQFAPLNGMVSEDFDNDGNLDVLVAANDFGAEVNVGRYDAGNGLLLKGDGKGNFIPLSILQSGWYIPGNAKSVIKLRNKIGEELIAVSQNRGALKLYKPKTPIRTVPLEKDDVTAMVKYRNGKFQKIEVNYGSSFLSQSARFLSVTGNATSAEVINSRGNKRILILK